jgi:flagellar biosynthesis/type III secretory pathway chaperone
MNHTDALKSTLQEQLNAYSDLLDLLKEERACLVEIQPAEIERISKEKDTVVMRLRLLEEERQRLTLDFARMNGLSEDINLDEIGRFTGDRIFHDLRSRLLSILQGIEEMNRFNSVLIDRSLQYVRTATGFFNSFGKGTGTASTGVLLSKES